MSTIQPPTNPAALFNQWVQSLTVEDVAGYRAASQQLLTAAKKNHELYRPVLHRAALDLWVAAPGWSSEEWIEWDNHGSEDSDLGRALHAQEIAYDAVVNGYEFGNVSASTQLSWLMTLARTSVLCRLAMPHFDQGWWVEEVCAPLARQLEL